MQVGHCCSDDDMSVEVAVLEPINYFGHQRRNLVGIGSLVEQLASAPCDADGTGTPAAGVLVTLEGACVEVKVEDDAFDPLECGIARHHPHVIHGLRVGRDCHAVFIVGAWRLVSADDGDRLVLGNAEALDRGRAFDGACLDEAPQCSEPWPCLAHS